MNKTHYGFFFFLLLIASQMMVKSEEWKCRTRSTKFKGECYNRSRICNSTCHDEGFPLGGECIGCMSCVHGSATLKSCFCKNSSCE
ncbi:unnamed protein product [Trifolium pratense]|uniref:Uncharacterized protein n=2 Tax=Trifolium pratense TaxID=57577 RepID=A0ACB0JD18_TRIPR|nr:unnamed protein product [Trifolium pratense]CAJ2641394.1 unnamed protein product [Trifolium pratense]